jgi:hypothetical protein
MGISVLLVALAIGSGVFTAAVEDAEKEEEAGQAAQEASNAAESEAPADEAPAEPAPAGQQ